MPTAQHPGQGFLKGTVGEPVILKGEASMCLKVHESWAMPEETALVGKVMMKDHNLYRLIGERIFEKCQELDYAVL